MSTHFMMDIWLLSKLRAALGNPPIRLVLRDGAEAEPSDIPPVGSVIIRDRRSLLKLIVNPEIHFGEGYTKGGIEIGGSLVAILEAVYRSTSRTSWFRWYQELVSRWLEWRQANSLHGSRQNIHHHYDIGTDFYKLWLDSQLLYTCAYFPSPSDSLEDAQVAKMHYVCRKVGLQPGETVVEAGCGWGALALHMAKYYGVTVRAFNVSHEQIVYARKRAQEEGLHGRVEFIEDDYRNISGRFDVFMSVGMLEHVGPDHFLDLADIIHRCLPQNGRGFLHFIGRNYRRPLSAWIRKRIFPGACPPTLRQVMDIFERWDFSVLDVENLRLHYAKTLEHWLDRFERSVDRVTDMFGPEFVRAWRLYLAGSMVGFRTGTLQLFQIAFARASNNRVPWTRTGLYAADSFPEQEQKWIPAMS